MRDMTVGHPRQHLWAHALPLLLGNWMQLSYNAVDSIIAGRFIGSRCTKMNDLRKRDLQAVNA